MSEYKFKPDKYSSHTMIVEYIKNIGHKRLKILDVGCSKGFIGKELNQKHDFYGIDVDQEDLKIAKKYYKEVQVVDIDRKKTYFRTKFFDIIIMADVIEHLKDPLEIILYFEKLLKNGGVMILSVPNVANLYIRVKLLFGNFDYEEKGILDRTHLKFFTLKSFRNLIRNAGLNMEKEQFTPIPLPTINPIFSDRRLLNFVYKIVFLLTVSFKTMFAFQFIAYCRLRER